MTVRLRLLVSIVALAFLTLHVLYLPRALEDPDSINFALGVESFDVAKHQPHPPGYPLYMALAKLSTRAVEAVAPTWDRDRRAVAGLAFWSVAAGTAAAFVLSTFWIAVGLPANLAVMAALLTMMSPLFWITAARPLTDVTGLVAALVVQTWLFAGWRQVREGVATMPRPWILAALGVGLIPGLRSQTMWLTGPLACWAIGELLWRRRWSHATLFCGLVVGGGLAWLIPLVVLSGGPSGYLRVLGGQGAEDFAGVEMLATIPTLDMLKFALTRTFLVPWQDARLGWIISILALVGVARMARRSAGVLATLCLAFWPYLVFHLTFQQTLYTRYALPILVPVSGLAVIGLAGLARRLTLPAVAVLAAASLAISQPDLRAYSTQVAPLSRVARDMIDALRTTSEPPALLMHHPLWWSSRRTLDWYRSSWDTGPQPFPGDREWLNIVEHFRRGDRHPVWLLADVTRQDIALIDWRTRSVRGHYTRGESLQRLVGGDLLEKAAWIEIGTPGWMLGRGWALSPEVAGATFEDRRQPNRQPADAWLRRAPGPHRLMIGGRYLGGKGAAALVLALDGRELVRWTIESSPGWFVRWLDLPEGSLAGDDAYGALTVSVEAADGGRDRPELGLEQFDFAPAAALMYAFTDGWQELEQNPSTGLLWRWSSESNTIEVFGGGRDLGVRLSGESPLRYFDRPPTIRVVASGEEVGRFSPAADFDQTVTVPARLLATRPTSITIESDRVFVPAEVNGSPDRRRLGLRLYEVQLQE